MVHKDWARMEEADWHFRRLVRRFVKERDKIAIEGVSLPGMLILNAILRDGEQRLGDLAEQLDFTSGAVTAICDKLEKQGYAIRRRSEADRRSVALHITEEGRRMVERNWAAGTYMIDTIFGTFTPDELETQILFFRKLHDRLEGFAEGVLRQTKSLDDGTAAGTSEQNTELQRTNRFISY
ncbi:MarR family winged helix-turn-helix transcriptional regulator [Paenibacillus woosongensis]|uniref:MarR family winged helix-turn-helix transcriptional regulator n=1 Tax=Paenibacillus woosongensis TaxID=307580 RepID=A0AA95I7B5_9BACL|nr:MarR family winged helix-turn-helix transcriptional regulator [Paenibacillus woosongensis]WHX47030.1 MarR family winged helix-turn-helix transcriptional regulator [Paenibacillus woosongensis]